MTKEIRSLQILKNIFFGLLVTANVAVTVWGSQFQAVLFYLSEMPWLLFLHFPGPKIHITVETREVDDDGNVISKEVNDDGNVISNDAPGLWKRLLSRCTSYIFTFIDDGTFVAALLAAAANRQLAMMMLVGKVTISVIENLESRQMCLQLDELFRDFDKN